METGVQISKCESANIDEFAIVELEERLEMTAAAVDAEGPIEAGVEVGYKPGQGGSIKGFLRWSF